MGKSIKAKPKPKAVKEPWRFTSREVKNAGLLIDLFSAEIKAAAAWLDAVERVANRGKWTRKPGKSAVGLQLPGRQTKKR